mgnify:CR=1 FL=1
MLLCSANFVVVVVVRGIVFILVNVQGKVDDTGVDVIADNSSVGSLKKKFVKLGWDLNNYRGFTEKLNILVLMLLRTTEIAEKKIRHIRLGSK